VPSITTARPPLREDIDRRTHRYLVSMGVRTVCVVAAALSDGPFRWAFLAGALFLPYIAVVLANAGRERVATPEAFLDATAIGAGPAGAHPVGEPAAAPPGGAERWPGDGEGVDERAGG
jgi:hypothetical protein